jgi:hypothetical protein
VSAHSRHRVDVRDPVVELEKVARIEKLLDALDDELEQLYPSTSRDRLRARFKTGRNYGLARIREACEKVLERQAGRHV